MIPQVRRCGGWVGAGGGDAGEGRQQDEGVEGKVGN